ncbi:hypothetical protein ACFTY7_16480 [Streptomyces sp. NPDC057062]|uniref:hypothetical protein n=1 Tax=Streptomyces sp. NPDC057062 TaxID=3346011 RepID=UPI00362A1760
MNDTQSAARAPVSINALLALRSLRYSAPPRSALYHHVLPICPSRIFALTSEQVGES